MSRERPLSLQVSIGLIALSALSIVCMVGLAVWAANRVDESVVDRQVDYMQSKFSEQVLAVPENQRSVSHWTQAVVQLMARNHYWTHSRLTTWVNAYFEHDITVVFAPDDTAMAGATGKELVQWPALKEMEPIFRPLIAELRSNMDAIGYDVEALDALADLHSWELIVHQGVPAVISVRPMVPESYLTMREGYFVHATLRYFDATIFQGMADAFDLADVKVVVATSIEEMPQAAIALRGRDGKPVGYVEWTPFQPGRQVVSDALPGIVPPLLAVIALVGWLVRRLNLSFRALYDSQEQTQHLAFHDTLTDLPNRRLFEDRLGKAVARCASSGRGMALLYLDIDRFKNVNDTLGHSAGDELVRQVAHRLRASLDAANVVARIGGDEFAIICEDVDDDAVEALSQSLLAAMNDPFLIDGEPVICAISIGAVVAKGGAADCSSLDLMRKADIALYEAKGQGRARFSLFVDDMEEGVRWRREIESSLRTAMETSEGLGVAYQPLYDRKGSSLIGAEALVRWTHPILGPIAPDLFVAIAEERGLIDALGRWVMREACMVANRVGLPWIAVNVSPLQIRNEHFVEMVMDVLLETGLPANRLQIEITEGLLLESGDRVEAVLSDLRAKGVRVALDDFGTGYSSMNYLRRYAIDKLKIDKSFIQKLGETHDADAIVQAMITLAKSLRIKVTAEGVETQLQKDVLIAAGCDEFQGYLMSRPIPEADLAGLMDEQHDRRLAD